jgi:acetate kinase
VHIDSVSDDAADDSTVALIHAPGSTVEVWVVPTDEGRVDAREALMLTANGRRAMCARLDTHQSLCDFAS